MLEKKFGKKIFEKNVEKKICLDFFFRIRIRIRISLLKSITKVMLCVLKIPTKFGVLPQSFYQNQNSFQDQDQDHDFTLDFNTRPTFHTQKTPTKFCVVPLTPSKVILSIAKVHVQPDRQTDRETDSQTDGNFFLLFCVLRPIKHEHSSKGKNFFFTHAITILFLFTYSVCHEKVKIPNNTINITYSNIQSLV